MTAAVATPEAWTPRRHFRLPADDEAFLDASGYRWETAAEAGVQRVVIYGYSVPAGYTTTTVDLNLRIESGYPDTQVDMVYVYPALAKVSGGAIPALSTDQFDGKSWQRWSRHRTGVNPWRPGVDNVETHLAAVQHPSRWRRTRGRRLRSRRSLRTGA